MNVSCYTETFRGILRGLKRLHLKTRGDIISLKQYNIIV